MEKLLRKSFYNGYTFTNLDLNYLENVLFYDYLCN